MSEDLRYYFFDHDAEEHPSIPGDEGWKQMQQLLDKELPLSAKKSSGSHLSFIAAVLLSVTFLVTALPLQTYFKQKEFVASIKKEQGDSLIPEDTTQDVSMFQKVPVIINRENIPSENNNIYHKDLLPIFNEPGSMAQPFKQTEQHEQTTVDNNNKKNSLQEDASVIAFENAIKTQPAKTIDTSVINNTLQKKKQENDFHNTWQFNAGAAVNISLSKTFQSLRPYPFAEIKYRFTPKFFAGASVALLSPVGSKASGVKKTVYVNDTSYNVSNYNETLNYIRLTYADVAFTGGIQLSKQISIQSGIQVSRLLSSKTNTTLEPYDFNMNRLTMTGQDVSTLPTTPSAAPVYNNRIGVNKFDIRYVAGINYDLKKLSLSLQYQGGINPILRGDAVTTDKIKMITFKAAFRLK